MGAPVGATMRDTKHLEQRHLTWHCVKDVPRPLRSVLGCKRLVLSLRTHDLRVAQARRYEALAAFQRRIDDARKVSGSSPAVDAGLSWRATLVALGRGDPATVQAFGGRGSEFWTDGGMVQLDAQETAVDMAGSILSDHADSFAAEHGEEAARTMLDLAHGRATPLRHYVDAWLAEGGPKGPVNPRTAGQYRSDLVELEKWAKSAGIAPTIEAFTKAAAGRYVTEGLVGKGVSRGTANRKISTASSYWTWLGKRTAADVNPWRGQSMAKVSSARGAEKPKRPFTDGEVTTLLQGGADAELADAIRVAALSGMRIEEVYRLTVADCAGDWFKLRQAKTQAGVRRVPVHSGLAALVTRRTADKPAGAYVFHEAGPHKVGRERSMAVSKRFGHYRRRLKVDEAVEGQRQGRIDMHSLRRWFVSAARNAGIDRAVVAAVVGHEAGNITDDVYSGGPSAALMRACVEAVRLPAPAPPPA